MLKIEKTVLPSREQWEIIIEGMRNPMNSWDKIDSTFGEEIVIGSKDYNLMKRLAKGGAVHAKYRRMIPVWVKIDAPLYWWKEFDTYKVGTVANSCSTMHKIHAKEFTLDDFSHDRMCETENGWIDANDGTKYLSPVTFFEGIVYQLNVYREKFLATNDKTWWWQMIQLLPSSYNQKRTVMLNYEVLTSIYRDRRNHKLTEWHTFCVWIRGLPYSELITMEDNND